MMRFERGLSVHLAVILAQSHLWAALGRLVIVIIFVSFIVILFLGRTFFLRLEFLDGASDGTIDILNYWRYLNLPLLFK
jgi:hypothetical protein